MTRILFSVVALMALAACASTPGDTRVAKEKYQFWYVDQPEKERLELHLKSQYGKSFCLTISDWPNQGGKLDAPATYVSLNVDGHSYHLNKYTSEYCPGCAVKLPPHGELTGYLNYKDFNLPKETYNSPKALIMSPVVPVCD